MSQKMHIVHTVSGLLRQLGMTWICNVIFGPIKFQFYLTKVSPSSICTASWSVTVVIP